MFLESLEVNFHYVFRDIAGTASNIHVEVKMTDKETQAVWKS